MSALVFLAVLAAIAVSAFMLGHPPRRSLSGPTRSRFDTAYKSYTAAVRRLSDAFEQMNEPAPHPVADLATFLERRNNASPRV